jgi:hypothetical protein
MAPRSYKKAKRKNISVFKSKLFETTIGSGSILPLVLGEEVRKFVSLCQAINNMQELNDLEDIISWRWMVALMDNIPQAVLTKFSLQQNFCRIKICPIWKSKTEPQCRFFVGTLSHKRVLTANNLQKM